MKQDLESSFTNWWQRKWNAKKGDGWIVELWRNADTSNSTEFGLDFDELALDGWKDEKIRNDEKDDDQSGQSPAWALPYRTKVCLTH